MRRIFHGILLAGVLVLCLSGGAVAGRPDHQASETIKSTARLRGKDIRNHSLSKD